MSRVKTGGLGHAFAANRTITAIRDLIVLHTLEDLAMPASEIRDDVDMAMQETGGEWIYRVLNRLMKAKLIRWAQTSLPEVGRTDKEVRKKWYTLTPEGRKVLHFWRCRVATKAPEVKDE